MEWVIIFSIILNIIAIGAAFRFAVKNGRIKDDIMNKMVSANLIEKGSNLTMEKIVSEIDKRNLQNQRLEAIVDATPFPMLLTNEKGKIVWANQSGLNLLEIPNAKPTDFYGQSVSAFFYNEPDRPSVTDKVINSRKAITGIEASLKTRRDNTIYVLVDSGPIISKSGDLLGAYSIAVDMTRQKLAEMEVKTKNDALMKIRNDSEIMSSQLASSIEEFQNTVREIQRQVVTNEDISRKVSGFVDVLKKTFHEFNTNLTPVIEGVETLNEGLKNIESATATIKTISDQTDILALNARIEAERTTNAGMGTGNEGFKIVAKEVKELAIRAKEITSEIMIINNHIHGVVESSSRSLGEMKGKFDKITHELTNNTTSDELSNVSSEIKNMLFQIDDAISDMNKSANSLNMLIKGV